jgi:hypothetical protein
MDMAKRSNVSTAVACFGLAACLCTWRLARVLPVVMPTGEMSLLRGLSIILGVLLLAVASLRLLLKGFTHGKMFAIAAALLLSNLIHFYDWSMYWYDLGPGEVMALVGAVMGFRARRDAQLPTAEASP